MKATMNSEGVITISPETDGEAFALRQWIAMAEETTYIDEPGALSRKPVIAWAQSMLLVSTSVARVVVPQYSTTLGQRQADALTGSMKNHGWNNSHGF